MTWRSQSKVEQSTSASCRGHRSKHKPWQHQHQHALVRTKHAVFGLIKKKNKLILKLMRNVLLNCIVKMSQKNAQASRSRALWNFCRHIVLLQHEGLTLESQKRIKIDAAHSSLFLGQNLASTLPTVQLDCKQFNPRCMGVTLGSANMASGRKPGELRSGLQRSGELTPHPSFFFSLFKLVISGSNRRLLVWHDSRKFIRFHWSHKRILLPSFLQNESLLDFGEIEF